jgi:hypothetical protein
MTLVQTTVALHTDGAVQHRHCRQIPRPQRTNRSPIQTLSAALPLGTELAKGLTRSRRWERSKALRSQRRLHDERQRRLSIQPDMGMDSTSAVFFV